MLEIKALQQRNQELGEKISTILETASLGSNVQHAPSTSSALQNWQKLIDSDRKTRVNVSNQLYKKTRIGVQRHKRVAGELAALDILSKHFGIKL